MFRLLPGRHPGRDTIAAGFPLNQHNNANYQEDSLFESLGPPPGGQLDLSLAWNKVETEKGESIKGGSAPP